MVEPASEVGEDRSWRALVDLEVLARWMDGQGLGVGPIEGAHTLPGGTQNVLMGFTRAGRGYVLRRPPLHPTADGNGTMRREMRVLGALAGTDVPHPGLIAGCPDTDVLGSAFYLMEPIDGFNAAAEGLSPLHAGSAEVRHAMGLSLIDGIVALGRVDPFAKGLDDLGRLDGWLERQAPRWRRLLESYREHEGWPGPESLPGVDRIAAWLEANRPATLTPGIMHGDYHMANVLFRRDGPELAAIVDWELTTLGDPMLDLGMVLAGWPEDGAPTGLNIQPWDGFPTTDELIAHYAEGSGRDMSVLPWFRVLACYKLGLILEGSHARACAGKASHEVGDRLHASTLSLLERALKLISEETR